MSLVWAAGPGRLLAHTDFSLAKDRLIFSVPDFCRQFLHLRTTPLGEAAAAAKPSPVGATAVARCARRAVGWDAELGQLSLQLLVQPPPEKKTVT